MKNKMVMPETPNFFLSEDLPGIKKIFPQKSGGKTIVDIILDKVKNYLYGESLILRLSLLLQLMEERVVWTNLFKTKNLSQP